MPDLSGVRFGEPRAGVILIGSAAGFSLKYKRGP